MRIKSKLWLALLLHVFSCVPVQDPPQEIPTAIENTSPSPSAMPSASNTSVIIVEDIVILAGNGKTVIRDGAALDASFTRPVSLCLNPSSESIYILDTQRVRELTSKGQIVTLAGKETPGFKDGSLEDALFDQLSSCQVDAQGQIYLSDYGNRRIRKIDRSGKVSTVVGNGEKIRKDGPLNEATLSGPESMILLENNTLYWTERQYIRKLENNQVSTLNPNQEYPSDFFTGPDSTDETIDKFYFGDALLIANDLQNNIYIADSRNRKIIMISDEYAVKMLRRSNTVSDFDDWVIPLRPAHSEFWASLFWSADSHKIFLYNLKSGEQQRLDFKDHKNAPKRIAGMLFAANGKDLIVSDFGTMQIKKIILNLKEIKP